MFTGLVQELGRVSHVQNENDSLTVKIYCVSTMDKLELGESVSVNGVCLTVTEISGDSFTAHVSPETLSLTTLGNLREGTAVNLERSLTLQTRLGGHMVQGHVDGIGTVISIAPEGEGQRWHLTIPQNVAATSIHKGSIALDGISLTIASINGNEISIALIPKTLELTNLQYLQVGDSINVEGDVIGKYVQKLLGEKTEWGG